MSYVNVRILVDYWPCDRPLVVARERIGSLLAVGFKGGETYMRNYQKVRMSSFEMRTHRNHWVRYRARNPPLSKGLPMRACPFNVIDGTLPDHACSTVASWDWVKECIVLPSGGLDERSLDDMVGDIDDDRDDAMATPEFLEARERALKEKARKEKEWGDKLSIRFW